MTNKDFFVNTWQSEMKKTLAAVKGMPADTGKWSYKINEKARSAAAIVGHILPHAEVMSNATETFIADEHTTPLEFNSIEEAAAYWEKWAGSVIEKLNAMDESTWNEKIVDFRVDGKSFYQMPMSSLGWMMMFDIIHHRGQLTTYYRHMGVRNPSIYGPTAEDIEAMMAAQQN